MTQQAPAPRSGYKAVNEFLNQLTKTVHERCASNNAEKIVQFSEIFYAAFHPEEFSYHNSDDLYALTLAAWDFFQVAKLNEPKVRIYNPELEEHGWRSSHSVVEVLAQDSPFLVDSIRMELNALGLTLHFINTVAMNVVRDSDAQVQAIYPLEEEVEGARAEALMFFEIDKITERQRLHILDLEVKKTLLEVRAAVTDFAPMLKKLHVLRQAIVNEVSALDSEKQEAIDFIDWLASDHFTFLGFKSYQVECDAEQLDANCHLVSEESSALGVINANQSIDVLENVDTLSNSSSRLVFAKSATKSRIHRPVYFDLILIRQFDAEGRCIAESRFLGLFTSRVYVNSIKQIPVLRKKLDETANYSAFSKGGYSYKAITDVVEHLPKDELFQMDQESLNATVLGIIQMQERPIVKAFFRQGDFDRFVTALVYTPRDKYSTKLREKFQTILCEHLAVDDLEFYTYFSQSNLARAHFILRLKKDSTPKVDTDKLEKQLRLATRDWDDDFKDSVLETLGEERGMAKYRLFNDAFPASYIEDFGARTAVSDLQKIEELQSGASISMSFYRALEDDANCYRIKLYRADEPFSFSDVLSVFQNLGLDVASLKPYEIQAKKGDTYYFYDFRVSYQPQQNSNGTFVLEDVRDNFQSAFENIWKGRCENDGFNKLVLSAGLDWRQVMVLRSYAGYLKQTGFMLSQNYIESSLLENAHITKDLVELFNERFSPDRQIGNDHRQQLVVERITAALDNVDSLDEDRIIRRYLDVIKGTIRTNFFCVDENGKGKDYVSFKMDAPSIPDLPKPVPKYEIYVYASFMEGVHLRGGKVARGGLRWSERKEDFRTEILGLVKAQQVKNAVIVPVGAKGGFVAKRVTDKTDAEIAQAEVLTSYRTFIRGLLDVTDNLVAGKLVKPSRVVCIDDDDPYLVVAADKGTANFSDVANEISAEYKHWLGDAFASGGSIGYNHKEMGITARGAWVAVQRHFREMGVDVQKDNISVLGIGDMSGDVFGNGMLLSTQIQLKAAFDWRYIFIDPTPNAATSFAERKRLFELPRSSWLDYESSLISAGGGVFARNQKSISITPEMQLAFDIKADSLTPTELISELLKAPVDLIWNGGVGTYIKSSAETDAMVGDKANDGLRVNGSQVRARVVGEGGNLGLTQLGRVEFSQHGGVCNTDFIDNSAGVDCSDHEVNIKILLDDVVSKGDMTQKQRNKMLASMTEDVADLVLHNNYRQNQSLSIALHASAYRLEEYKRFIEFLSESGKLDRNLEFLPSDEELAERKSRGDGLYRPELAVLFCYCKSYIKEALINSDVPDDPLISEKILDIFPKTLSSEFGGQLRNHRLQREIVATQVANSLVNFMGITFITRMRDATGAHVAQIARGFIAAGEIFSLPQTWSEIEALDNVVSSDVQLEMMSDLSRLVRRATRWFLRNRRCEVTSGDEVADFKVGIESVLQGIPNLIVGSRLNKWNERYKYFETTGFPENLANIGASCDSFFPVLGIIEIARMTNKPVEVVASTYFKLGDDLELSWVATKIDGLKVENHWQSMAREAYRDDLEWQQRALTLAILRMNTGEPLEETTQLWMSQQEHLVARWQTMAVRLRAADWSEFSIYTVALRELMDLAQASAHTSAPK